MTERRPPPPLGTFRPTKDNGRNDQRRANPAQAPELSREQPSASLRPPPPPEPQRDVTGIDGGDMPRIVTSRVGRDPRTAPPPPPFQPRTQSRRPPPPPPEREGMSGLRIVLYGIFGLFAFLAAAAIAAFVLVPTGLIRDRLQAEVKARTGRDLIIAGSTTLSLWPRPAVSVKDLTLSGPPDMGAQPLLRVAEVEVAIQILPLLLHDVSVDRLVLRQPQFDLRIDAKGRRSWDFADAAPGVWPSDKIRFAQATSGDPKALPKELQDFMRGSSDTANRNTGSQGKSRIGDISLGNVGIVDGTVHYSDNRAALDETVSALNAQFALANIASPLDVKGDFKWRGEVIQLTGQISPFRALLEGRAIEAHIKTNAAPLTLSFDGVMTAGTDLDIDGHVTASAPALSQLARWTGRPFAGSLPGGFLIDAKLKQSSALTALSDAQLSFGPLKGNGTISVDTHGARPYVKGAIRVATLDLNMLQAIAEVKLGTQGAQSSAGTPATTPPATPTTERPKSIEDLLQTPPGAPAGNTRLKQVRGYTKRQGWSDEPIDMAALGLLDADVRVGFEHVVWQELTTGSGQINVALKSKAARVTFEDVQLYDGRARGIFTVDGTAADAVVGANIVAEGVAALPLLKGFADFDWLSGRARIAIAVAGRGATERQIVSTLNGKADVAIADGALMGLNVPAIVRNLSQGKLGGLERSATEKTDFTEFAASAQLTNGIVRNDDLRIASAQVKATGAGTIDLPQRTMDYLLRPKVITGATSGIDVPLKIQGSIDKPTVTPELSGLLRDPSQAVQAISDAAKTPAGREVQETLKGVLQGDPAARNKVKGFLDQLLKQ